MLGRGPRSNSLSNSSGSSSGRTPDPRPNVLSGQVAPNALSTRGARQAANQSPVSGARTPGSSTSPQAAPAPNRTATATASAPTAFPASAVSPRARTRRPFSIWSLVVVGFIVINLARGFLAAGSPDPTEPPPTIVSTNEPAPTVAAAPGSAGVVEFGTEQDDDCTFPETSTGFDVGTAIFWSAQFKHSIAARTQVEWSIAHDGAVLDSGTGPADTPPGAWDSICSGEPLRYFAVGDYTLEVWTSGHGELLSTGTYTLFGLEATPASTP